MLVLYLQEAIATPFFSIASLRDYSYRVWPDVIMSFQFKDRKKIVACLFFAGTLISSHFILLEQWTAASLMIIATVRYLTSVFSTSSTLKYLFCTASVVSTILTCSGVISVISCFASIFQTVAAFNKDDRRLRELMLVGTTLWLINNYLVGSPAAVVMEVLFISSNLIAYYRYYYKNTATVWKYNKAFEQAANAWHLPVGLAVVMAAVNASLLVALPTL